MTGSSVSVVVDFWAEWCAPCKKIEQVLDELAEELSGKVKLGKVNVDVDENKFLVDKFEIRSIPTLLVLNHGEVQCRIVGAQNKNELQFKLDAFLK